MDCRPMIGLNAEYRPARKDSSAYSYLSAGYYDSILAAGGIPVIIPPLENEADVNCVLDRLQGLVLVGGHEQDG